MRSIRPLKVVGLCTALLLGISLSVPVTAEAAQTRRKSTSRSSTLRKAPAKKSYSASASRARKARLARARAAAKAREAARVAALREAMTPRYKTDALTGALNRTWLDRTLAPLMAAWVTSPARRGCPE